MTFIGVRAGSLPFPLDLCEKERYLTSVVGSIRSQQMMPQRSHSNLSQLILILVRIPISSFQFHWWMYKLRQDIRFHRDFPIIEAAKYSRSSVDRLNEGLERFCEALRDSEQELKRLGVDQRRLYLGAYVKLVRCRRALEDIVEARHIALNRDFRRIIDNRIAEVRDCEMGHT